MRADVIPELNKLRGLIPLLPHLLVQLLFQILYFLINLIDLLSKISQAVGHTLTNSESYNNISAGIIYIKVVPVTTRMHKQSFELWS
jgi:hypothetical protein